MGFDNLNYFHKKLRGRFQRTSTDGAVQSHTISTGVLAVSRPIVAFSPLRLPSPPSPGGSTIISAYRHTSDIAQAVLPIGQAVAEALPIAGGIIKGVIGGILSTLQVIDKHIQNKGDLEKLTLRLHLLQNHIDNAPTTRTAAEDTLRLQLLCALQTAKSQLERLEKRFRGAPALTQDIAGCITTVNGHLFEYMVLSQMQLQNDVSEIKANIECHTRQMQLIENFVRTGTVGQLPAAVSRGHVILVDATGREHPLLLDQCRYLDQLDFMLRASLFQCRPDETEIQMWYIKRKQYDFVIYSQSNSNVIQLTRESDIWSNMEPGTRIVMRVIIEEKADVTATATYKCPCGTLNTIKFSVVYLGAASQWGCTITCQHCERRFQITRTRRSRNIVDDIDSQEEVDTPPRAEAKHLIRHFLAKQVTLSSYSIASRAMLEANSRRRRHPAQFQCSDCGQTFTAVFSLKRHAQSHTGERPFACSIPGCMQRFYNSSDCKRHEKSVKRHKDLLV